MTNQISWSEHILHSLQRERESDAFYRTSDDDPESTYWTKEDVEALHAEFGQDFMRIAPDAAMGEMGGPAGVLATQVSTAAPVAGIVGRDFQGAWAIEQGLCRIISAKISPTPGAPFKPAQFLLGAQWARCLVVPSARMLAWTVMNSHVFFKGDRLRLLYIVEPTLSDFQSNTVYMPSAGYFEMACDWVHHQLTVADGLPIGRA